MQYRGLTLDAFQEKAISHIQQQQSVIISAPTGSGKTLIAEYAIEIAIQNNLEVVYTAPIKALSNQKFRDFTRNFGAENVGIMTGDVTYHGEAKILIMTTEIFRNALFENPSRFDRVLYLILDEVHYLDDADRGSVWEESIIFAPSHIRLLCLSATVPNIDEIAGWINKVRSDTIHVICESKRSVPLQEMSLTHNGIMSVQKILENLPKRPRKDPHHIKITPASEVIQTMLSHLQGNNQLPCLCFVFSRKACERNALLCSQFQFLNAYEREKVLKRYQQLLLAYGVENSRAAREFGSLVGRGIAYHHAGMIPAYKEMVEQLFTEGCIKLLFATETFALGINMPARSVFFEALYKFDGEEMRPLKALEYQQMSGRAGRRGIDAVGYVYSNMMNDIFSASGLKKIIHGPLEEIVSQFNLSYSALLSLYARLGMDVTDTYEKSLGAYHRTQSTTMDKKHKHSLNSAQRSTIKKKLALMRNLGYLQDDGLTSKGRFATFINGYEIQLTELFFSGFLEDKKTAEIFCILVALAFDGKSENGNVFPRGPMRKIAQGIVAHLKPPKSMEGLLGLKSEIKDPDFTLWQASLEWAEGRPFAQLPYHNKTSPGDIIRAFRQAIQICRQLKKACQGYDSFASNLDTCLGMVNRDEVNALSQLQAFAEL